MEEGGGGELASIQIALFVVKFHFKNNFQQINLSFVCIRRLAGYQVSGSIKNRGKEL